MDEPQKNKSSDIPAIIIIAVIAGLFSKAILERSGFKVNYQINGEDIQSLWELEPKSIAERLQLAIQEERYEDAARLRDMIKAKENPEIKTNQH